MKIYFSFVQKRTNILLDKCFTCSCIYSCGNLFNPSIDYFMSNQYISFGWFFHWHECELEVNNLFCIQLIMSLALFNPLSILLSLYFSSCLYLPILTSNYWCTICLTACQITKQDWASKSFLHIRKPSPPSNSSSKMIALMIFSTHNFPSKTLLYTLLSQRGIDWYI